MEYITLNHYHLSFFLISYMHNSFTYNYTYLPILMAQADSSHVISL